MKIQRALAVTLGGLGDAILFSPALKALRRKNPDATIDLLLASPLALQAYHQDMGTGRAVLVNTSRHSPMLKAMAMLPFALSSRLHGGYDLAIYATGLNPRLVKFLEWAANIKESIRAPGPPAFETDLLCNLELARRFDPTITKQDVYLPVKEKHCIEARAVCRENGIDLDKAGLLAIYPSRNLHHRPRWPLANLAGVAEGVQKKDPGRQLVVIGSSEEGKEWEESVGDKLPATNLCGKLSILALAALLSKCSLALCNDGGLMHVAGAVGCPLVAVMPNTPISYLPPGENTVSFHSRVSCAPCYPNRPKTCLKARCLEDISLEEVVNSCLNFLLRTP